MQNVMDSFLKNMKKNKRRHLRIISVLLVLSLLVSTEVFWMLRQTGIAMAGDATCGIEEHAHTDECADDCDKEEHIHSVGCYADRTADVETETDWQTMFENVSLTGKLGTDLATIAKTQIGYRESERNFEVDSLGNRNGYTRYGAWYGSPYNNWSAMFVSFCLHFAGSPTEQTPYNIGANAMVTMWEKLGKYTDDESYVPTVGDLMFTYDNTVGIVYDIYDDGITVIMGDVNGEVISQTIQPNDSSIKGWGLITTDTDTNKDPSVDLSEQYKAWAVVSEPVTSTYRLSRMAAGSTSLMADEPDAAAAAAAGTMFDMTDMITSVNAEEMINDVWTEISSGSTVTRGDRLRFTISYTVPKQTLSVENNVIYYNLPANITSVQGATGNVYNDAGTVVGTFVLDKETNQIRIAFNNEYAKRNEDGAEIIGGFSFITTVDSIFQEGEDTKGLIFNDKITVELKIKDEVEVNGDVHVEKTIAEITGNTIKYKVRIFSNEGTYTNVVLTDTMTGGLVFKEFISGLPDGSSYNMSGDKTSFTATLPKMSAGGSYVIEYTAELPAGSIKSNNLVNNKAEVESTDDQNNSIKDSSEVDHTFIVLDKRVTIDGNGNTIDENGNISWIIEVNKSKLDISGWTLSDTIRINGISQDLDATVVINDSAGNMIYTGELPYKFPSGSNDTYKVTYTTSHDKTGQNQTIINKAKLERDEEPTENPIEDQGSVGIGVGDPLKKTGDVLENTLETRDDGTQWVKVKWTVVIDTSDGPIGYGIPALDGDGTDRTYSWYLMDNLDDDQYMTYDQLEAAVTAFKNAVNSQAGVNISEGSYHAALLNQFDESGNWIWHYNAEDTRTPHLQKDSLYECFRFYIPAQIPKGKTITFSYECWAPYVGGTQIYNNHVNFNNYYYYEEEGEAHFVSEQPTIEKIAKWPGKFDVPNPNLNWREWGGESNDSNVNLDYDVLFYDLLSWRIQVNIPSTYTGNLTVTEHLPEGLTISSLQARTDNESPLWFSRWKNDGTATYQGFQWQVAVGQLSIPIVISGNDITFTVSEEVVKYILDNIPEANKDEGGYKLYFYIFAQMNDDAEWTADSEDYLTQTATFENNVTLKDGNGDTFGTATQTQVITKDQRKYLVEKFHANGTADNFVTYEVVLNKDGLDLDPTQDYLDVEDILSYSSPNASPIRVRLIPGSVELYTYSDAAGFVPTKITDFSYTYNEASVNDTSNAAVIWTNTLALTIPDETPVKLVYRYEVTGKEGDVAKLDNECSIVGKYSGSIDDSDHMEFIMEKPSATANITSVYIYKVDIDNNGLFLPGAEFNLYMYHKDSGEYQPVVDETTNENRVFTTDEDGTFSFHFHHDDEQEALAYHLAYNVAYKLVETRAPEGYFLNPEPYEFYVMGSGTEFAIPDGYTGHVHVTGDLIYYEDRKTDTEISIEKIWQDADGNVVEKTDGEISVQLYRRTKNTEDEAYGEPIVLSAANGWKVTVTGLPANVMNADGSAGDEYLYYVKESEVNLYTPYYQNNGGIGEGKITIVNREDANYALPATGGSGTLPIVLLGIVMITIPVIYGFISRRKRERRLKG